jgi:GNAT superfamily N-acetyltransferase
MLVRAFDESWDAVWPIFREVVRAADTFAYDPSMTKSTARETWIEPAGGSGLTVVAVKDGRILGTAMMERNRPGPGSDVSTASFMVSADARGLGVGRRMVAYALDWARNQGYAGMQFNAVAESNVHAVHPSPVPSPVLLPACRLDAQDFETRFFRSIVLERRGEMPVTAPADRKHIDARLDTRSPKPARHVWTRRA